MEKLFAAVQYIKVISIYSFIIISFSLPDRNNLKIIIGILDKVTLYRYY